MTKKKTVLTRVPREVDNILRMKMPNVESASRWGIVYDTSAIKLDHWLGKELQKNVKKKQKR